MTMNLYKTNDCIINIDHDAFDTKTIDEKVQFFLQRTQSASL